MHPQERIVTVRPRTVLAVIGIILSVAALLAVIWISRQVLTWIAVAVFLEQGNGAGTAAPVASRIFGYYFSRDLVQGRP